MGWNDVNVPVGDFFSFAERHLPPEDVMKLGYAPRLKNHHRYRPGLSQRKMSG